MPKLIEVTNAEEFRTQVEEARAHRSMSSRGVALAADAAHGSFWLWLNSKPESVTLKNALAYAKAVGLRVFLRRT